MPLTDDKPLHELLRRARGLPESERISFLQEACGADSDLFEQASRQLFVADAVDADYDADDVDERASASVVGAHIGPYRIVRELGRGGMGEVVLAEREAAEFKQQVAIKFVRRGLISRQLRGRLKTERQILARLNHPNIARLLDGGAAEDGTPYLVMEYVEGKPIDVYCDENRLSLQARIQLFQTVCRTAHHAHQNLILHRDLKPSNILVAKDGSPKLLDFGIAKLLDERDTMHTLALTHADYRMLTPDHASPEQIQGLPLTTASDVYVLGILLYELITGSRPFDVSGMRLAEMEEAICGKPPTPPSVLLDALAPDEAEKVAARRAIALPKLKRSLRGDLDNIVLMALRKEPERRYSSAEELSSDLERYLNGLPVLARPDTWTYRTQKFVRRHAIGVGLSVALAASILTLAIVSYTQAVRLAEQRDLVTSQREIAELQKERAEQVSAFLVDLFRVSDPSETRGNQITAREILDLGAQKIERDLQQQPELRATLLETIGRVYFSLGLLEPAEQALERSLELRRSAGVDDGSVASSLAGLAEVLIEKGEYDEAERLQREALERQRRGGSAVEAAKGVATLGRLFRSRGSFDEAESLLLQSARLYEENAPTDPGFPAVLSDLALIALDRGQLPRAEELYERAIVLVRTNLGEQRPEFALQVHNLALVQQARGNMEAAEQNLLRSLSLFEQIYGERHIETIRAASNYALFLRQSQRLTESEAAYRRVLELDKQVRGPRHSLVGYDMANLASVLILQNERHEAKTLLRQALSIYEDTLPADHPHAGAASYMLGYALLEDRQLPQARALLERSAAIMKAKLPDTVTEATVRGALGRTYMQLGRLSEAEPLLLSSYELLREKSPGHANTVRGAEWIAELFAATGRAEEARKYRMAAKAPAP